MSLSATSRLSRQAIVPLRRSLWQMHRFVSVFHQVNCGMDGLGGAFATAGRSVVGLAFRRRKRSTAIWPRNQHRNIQIVPNSVDGLTQEQVANDSVSM